MTAAVFSITQLPDMDYPELVSTGGHEGMGYGSIAYTITLLIGLYRWLEPDKASRAASPVLTT